MTNSFPRHYRLGIDVGSNSLGWFVVWLNKDGSPGSLGPGGVRIYPDGRDPKSKSSNAVTRRHARGARRLRDRYLKRRADLMEALIETGLMPGEEQARKALESLDPYAIRAGALDTAQPLHHVGRCLFHLDQRRGFQSNRKTEQGDEESGVIKEAAGRLRAMMEAEQARTLGEFLYRRHKEREPVRIRNRSLGGKAQYDFYPLREMVLAEFEAIWRRQAEHHPEMTADARARIHDAIFFQRDLKPPLVGKCSLEPAPDLDDRDGFRCPWAHPLAQQFRIWQEVRNLEIIETGRTPRRLEKAEGDLVALALFKNKKLTFDKIRGLLGLSPAAKFNLESDKRSELLGDQTAVRLSATKLFGKSWWALPLARQIEVVMLLLDDEDESQVIARLRSDFGLDQAAARAVSTTLLPDGHCRLGLRAIGKLVPRMAAGMSYPEAVATEYGHPHQPTGERSRTGYLPYYGEWLADDVLGTGDPGDNNETRWGRFPNPTVHIGLGQIRRTVNALIRVYGPPAEVVVEMTRAFKLSPVQLARVESEQLANQRRNDERRDTLRAMGLAENPRNVLKLRLWEELNPKDPLDRRCPFTGESISIARLFSEDVEIEHLIPFQDSWDDSAANKTLSMRFANRAKGKQTPYEAFSSSPRIDGFQYDWDAIVQRAAGLPRAKRRRFEPHARERLGASEGFQARLLNETGWLASVAKRYLAAVVDPYKINVLPGRLTALIRAKWGLKDLLPDHNYSDSKNRKDHRHHAVDALVAAMTDRSLLHRMSSAYDDERDKIAVPLPWPSLKADLAARLKTMYVSHKPDHGTQAQLHEGTAYGPIKDPAREGGNLVYRKPFLTLTEQQIERIRDRRLRDLVKAHVEAERRAGRDLKAALQSFAARKDIPGLAGEIRHVRLVKTEQPEYLVTLRDKSGKPYKSYSAGENAYVEIFETPEGKWLGEAMLVFRANQADATMKWPEKYPGSRLVMRIFKGDLIALDLDDRRAVMVVRHLDASNNRFKLAEHNEAGNLDKRHADGNDPFRWLMASYGTLKNLNAEPVRIDEIGRVWRVTMKGGGRTV